MKKYFLFLTVMTACIVVLSGCLFPDNELSKNKVPNEAQLEMVQTAVTQYKEETNGLVPIKTKEDKVDQYEKYLIDFSTLKEEQLLAETPGTAYENGGVYQYVIITPEEDPKVKLIDLRLSEKIRELHTKITIYRSKHSNPPFGEQIADGIYKVNYEKLGYSSEPVVVSPYTHDNLPIVMNEEGNIFIDYRIDLQRAINEFDHDFQEGDDIRTILEDEYLFVPAYSLPYTIEQNEVVFMK